MLLKATNIGIHNELGRTHGTPYRGGYMYVPLRFGVGGWGGNVFRRMGTQQQIYIMKAG